MNSATRALFAQHDLTVRGRAASPHPSRNLDLSGCPQCPSKAVAESPTSRASTATARHRGARRHRSAAPSQDSPTTPRTPFSSKFDRSTRPPTSKTSACRPRRPMPRPSLASMTAPPAKIVCRLTACVSAFVKRAPRSESGSIAAPTARTHPCSISKRRLTPGPPKSQRPSSQPRSILRSAPRLPSTPYVPPETPPRIRASTFIETPTRTPSHLATATLHRNRPPQTRAGSFTPTPNPTSAPVALPTPILCASARHRASDPSPTTHLRLTTRGHTFSGSWAQVARRR